VVDESGREAPTFIHHIYRPGLCHFDAAPAAGEIYFIILLNLETPFSEAWNSQVQVISLFG